MRVVKTVVMLVGLTGWALSGYAATNLPFSADFDTLTVGQALPNDAAWDYGIAPTGVSGTPDGSTRAIYAADGVTLSIANGGPANSNVWWSGYAKVRAHATPPTGTETAAAAFYVSTAGELWAFSSNAYVEVVASGVPTSGWVGFAVHLDYANELWDLYTTYTPGDPLVKRNGNPLLFNTNFFNSGEFSSADVSGETYLDAIAVSRSSQAIVDATASPANVQVSSSVQLTLDDVYSGLLLQYFGGTGTLNGPFGEALAGLLLRDDEVGIFDPTQNPPWVMASYEGAYQWSTNITFTNTTAIYIKLNPANTAERPNSFVANYGTPTSHATGVPTTIYGTNSTGGAGWNLVAVPGTAQAVTISDLTPVGAQTGDRIYIRTGGRWSTPFYYSGTGWITMSGRAADNTLVPRSPFWYRRNAAGTTTWNSDDLP